LLHELAENTRRHRDRTFIVADILKAARKGVPKTEIMYKPGLSSAQSKEYLSFLVGLDLVEVTSKRGKLIYKTTAKGMSYMKGYEEIRRLMQQSTKHNVTSPSTSFSS
jgi:predicted transcriptional regulator